jgi:hypothetical protein
MRKFYIGLISLAAVLVIYLLYSRLSKTPPVDTGTGAGFDAVADSNLGVFDSKVGKLGEVGVETFQKAYYFTLNKNNEVEREWGFERLLHEIRDIWEIEKPYMNIYRRNFKCYITADIGKVRVETAVGKSTPKDATFTGNVVVHILPEGSSNIKESYIYLDDFFFMSEKSQLSTAGPVKFVSEDALMLGTGLELVYDDVLERLEYLRIIDLESWHIKSSQTALLPGEKKQAKEQQPDKPADTPGRAKTQKPDKPVVASDKEKTQTTITQPKVKQVKGEYYKCVFSKNVLINSPEQLIFAHDKIFVNDIFWSKASNGDSDKVNTDAADDTGVITQPAEQGRQSADEPNTTTVTAARQNEPKESPEKLEDIVVTCDNGFIIIPMDSKRPDKLFSQSGSEGAIITGIDKPKELEDANDRTTFLAPKIDYSASTGDIIAPGPIELTFYDNSVLANETGKKVPVKITAQKEAKFFQASNKAVFEGDCMCEMLREDPNGLRRYVVSGQRFTVDLSPDKDKQPSDSGPQIKHFTADGGVVKLANVKMAGEKVLGGVELKCLKCEYDTAQQLFLATGPGVINLYNSNIPEPNSQPDKFSLNKPCWAIIEDFQTLEYSLQTNQLVVDAASQGLLTVNYFPIVNGEVQYDRQVTVTTPHVQANLIETAEGEFILSALSATGGITYKDQDKEFDGGRLFYDAGKSIVTVHGDELQPCHFNGAPVDAIEWNLKTDKINFKIPAPGALQL